MEYGNIKVNQDTANHVFTCLTLFSTKSAEALFRLWVLEDNYGRELQLTSRSLKESIEWADTVQNWTFQGVALIGLMYTSGQLTERNLYGLLGFGGGAGMLATTWANHRRDEVKSEIIHRVSKNLDILKELIEKKEDYELTIDFTQLTKLWPKVGVTLTHSMPYDRGLSGKILEVMELVEQKGVRPHDDVD